MRRTVAGLGVVVMLVMGGSLGGPASAGTCSDPLPQDGEPVTLDPADFVSVVDNPYLPWVPGSRWLYRETNDRGDVQTNPVVVLTRTKEILGIAATVVHDRVFEGGELIENTFDWYAQDVCGNVWYLGENTKEYENGVVVTTEGSWEGGVDGAQPGVIMPADPEVALTYREEYRAGVAEDSAKILSVDEQAQAPFGHFTDVVLTKEFTPVEPMVSEYKLFAAGIGQVLGVTVSGGSDREELVRFTAPSG